MRRVVHVSPQRGELRSALHQHATGGIGDRAGDDDEGGDRAGRHGGSNVSFGLGDHRVAELLAEIARLQRRQRAHGHAAESSDRRGRIHERAFEGICRAAASTRSS